MRFPRLLLAVLLAGCGGGTTEIVNVYGLDSTDGQSMPVTDASSEALPAADASDASDASNAPDQAMPDANAADVAEEAATCTPDASCASWSCGFIPNGCGKNIDCGGCSNNYICQASNTCGCPTNTVCNGACCPTTRDVCNVGHCCTPTCTGQCNNASDGCGGLCGNDCGTGSYCNGGTNACHSCLASGGGACGSTGTDLFGNPICCPGVRCVAGSCQ